MAKFKDKLNTILKPDINPEWPKIPDGWELAKYKKFVSKTDRYLCRDRMTEKLIWHVVSKHHIGKRVYCVGVVIRKK